MYRLSSNAGNRINKPDAQAYHNQGFFQNMVPKASQSQDGLGYTTSLEVVITSHWKCRALFYVIHFHKNNPVE